MKSLAEFEAENAALAEAVADAETVVKEAEEIRVKAEGVMQDVTPENSEDAKACLDECRRVETVAVEALATARAKAHPKITRRPVMAVPGMAKGKVIATGVTESGIVTATVEGIGEDGKYGHTFYSVRGLCVDKGDTVDKSTLIGWVI